MVYTPSTSQCTKRKREERKQKGICVKCDNKAEPNKTMCSACLEKNRKQCFVRNKLRRKLGVKILGQKYK